MTGRSSLPPLKKNDGKLAMIALLLLFGAGGLWFFLRDGASEPEAVAPEPPPVVETPPREEFAAELEIPDDDELAEPEPSSETKPASGSALPLQCNGRIDPAQVREVIRGTPSKQVQTCYENVLKNNNLLQGSMDVQLTIDVTGAVREVAVGGTLRNRQVYSCVRRVARTWKFPPPQGGCVRINAPFQMTPKL
jgi:hypothetical protein